MSPDSSPHGHEMGVGALIGMIALFVLAGGPLVYYLWTVVNDLLTAHVDSVRILIAVPVLLIFAGLLAILSRSVRRW